MNTNPKVAELWEGSADYGASYVTLKVHRYTAFIMIQIVDISATAAAESK